MIWTERKKNIIARCGAAGAAARSARRRAAGFAAVFLILSAAGCTPAAAPFQAADTAMGTVIRQKIYGTQDVTPEVLSVIKDLEQRLLSKREPDSQAGRINEAAGKEEILPEEAFYGMLERIWEVSDASGGALDVTVGPVVEVWNIDGCATGTAEFALPSEVQIAKALSLTGYEKVRLENGRVWLPEGMSLDLGAVGKGIACDAVAEHLSAASHVEGAVISIGGSILTYGQKPDGSPFIIGIQNPRPENGTGNYIGSLTLEGGWFVSTSGDYERYVTEDGKRYHHIINPLTGYPAESGLISVTVLSRSGFLSDALSTACFVLGKEEAFDLAKRYEAYIFTVDEEGKTDWSKGMERYLTP